MAKQKKYGITTKHETKISGTILIKDEKFYIDVNGIIVDPDLFFKDMEGMELYAVCGYNKEEQV